MDTELNWLQDQLSSGSGISIDPNALLGVSISDLVSDLSQDLVSVFPNNFTTWEDLYLKG